MSRSAFGRVYCRAHGSECRGGKAECHFYYRIRRGPEEFQKAVGHDRQTALDALASARLKLAREEALGIKIPDRVTFADFKRTFRPVLEVNRSERWVALSLKQYDAMSEKVGTKVLSDFERSDVEDLVVWLQTDRGIKGATANRYLATLSLVFKVAIQRGLATDNPCHGVKRAREEGKAIPWIEVADLRRIEAAVPAEFRALVAVAAETGMRRGEVGALEWRDVNLKRKVALVRKSKSKKPREVPLTAHAVAALSGIVPAPAPLRAPHLVFPGLDLEAMSRKFPGWCKAAGLHGYNFHALRHSFASRLMRKGVDPATIMRVGGWASLSMIMRYASHAPESAARQAIDAMEESETPEKKRKQA